MIDAQLDLRAFKDRALAVVVQLIEPCSEGSSTCLRELVLLWPWLPISCKAGSNRRYAQVRGWCPRRVYPENVVTQYSLLW